MGGSVNVVVRDSSGTIHKMERWTNNLVHWIVTESFLTEGKDFIDYIAQSVKWKSDYQKNKDTGKYEDDNSRWYGCSEHLAPIEYGMVLVDFIEKKIVSMQDYTNIDEELYHDSMRDVVTLVSHLNSESFDSSCIGVLEKNMDKVDNQLVRLYKLHQAGMISGIKLACQDEDGEFTGFETEDVSGKSFEEIINRAIETFDYHYKYDKPKQLNGFKISLRNFELINIDGPKHKDFKTLLGELGFTLTHQDEKHWEKWAERY